MRLSTLSTPRSCWTALLALLAFRLWFSVVLPMTGDEAYFVLWGEHPAGGYYDHPPMVGWWLTALLSISRAEWVLRLPVVLSPLILAAGAYWIVKPCGRERARLAALLVLLQPANVWNVLITTDTPVIIFSMLSIVAYVGALRSGTTRRALALNALAGALLGLAFLGKYFAALLGFAYLIHVLFIRRESGRWAGFSLLLLAALPAPIYNLWWNSGHCWVNILFNFINRNANAGLSWQNPLAYLGSLIYLATPWLLLALVSERGELRKALASKPVASAMFWLAILPLALFALMSLARSIGLHWLVSFIPLIAILASIVLREAVLEKLVKWSALFAALHFLAIVGIALVPMQTWKDNKLYDGIVLTAHSDRILAQLAPYRDDYFLSMEGYSAAATLAYHAQRPFAVFGAGSYHARQDDLLTDWRAQDGRKVLVLVKSGFVASDYTPFFEHVEFREFKVDDVPFQIVLGQGFNYAAYKEKVLTRIRDKYYRIPAWLPQRGCEFCERYFEVTVK